MALTQFRTQAACLLYIMSWVALPLASFTRVTSVTCIWYLQEWNPLKIVLFRFSVDLTYGGSFQLQQTGIHNAGQDVGFAAQAVIYNNMMLLLHFSVHIDYAVTFYQQSGGDISYTRLLLQHISTHASLVTTSESRPTTMIKYVSSKDNKRTLQVAYVTNERRPRGAIQDQRLKQTF